VDVARRGIPPVGVIDLHCHSTASDGLLSPGAVVQRAAAIGLTAVALTDHDTIAGVAEARAAADQAGMRFVAGCEFSADAPWGEIHLLGLFLDADDQPLNTFLTAARADRRRRAEEMLDKLAQLGMPMARGDLDAHLGGGAVGRPHVARLLLAREAVHSVQEAFDRYLGLGRPAYVAKRLPAVAEVAERVHAAGGLVSAAHLKRWGTREAIAGLQAQGVDAVETRHPGHTPDMVAAITTAALAMGLARTGGSDWHGESDTQGTHAMLGSQRVPDEWLDELMALRDQRDGGR
jgi:3',5'-nucleoside bisphosphate phosphatase